MVAITLLSCKLVISVLISDEHVLAVFCMLILGLLKKLVVVSLQFKTILLSLSCGFLTIVLLLDLLFNPVFLL